jgi:hypothetical protein
VIDVPSSRRDTAANARTIRAIAGSTDSTERTSGSSARGLGGLRACWRYQRAEDPEQGQEDSDEEHDPMPLPKAGQAEPDQENQVDED